jgi:hypothetical protein
MSSKNKNTVSQALLDMDTIMSAIKEESKKSLNVMLNEAVRDVLREACCKEDDEYDVIDDEEKETKEEKDGNEETDKKSEEEDSEIDEYQDDETEQTPQEPQQDEEMPEQGVEQPEDGDVEVGPQEEPEEADGDEWGKYAGYQVDKDTYDLTGENDKETVAKVYKLLTNDDNIIVRQDGDTIQLTDNEAGTEYVIDLGTDNDEPSVDSEEEPAEDGNLSETKKNIACFEEGSDNEYDPTSDYEKVGPANQPWMRKSQEISESKKRRHMNESKEVLFEVDLGYTDSYQDKDPIVGLSNEEPSKTGKSWHKGVPTGTKKPWAGPSKTEGDPFKENVNEEDEVDGNVVDEEPMEEGTNVGGAVQQRSNSKSHIPNNRKEHGAFNKRHVSTMPDGYDEMVAEAKKIKAENKKLKEAVVALKANLNEAYVTNVNLGKITKLFLENTTSQKEKIAIVNRFCNEAKTVKDSEKLYESISKELQNNKPSMGINLNETSKTANGTQKLNESVEYRSDDLVKTIDLMTRINNL